MEQQEVIHQGTEEDDQEARLRPEILFDLDAEQSKQASILEQEREKHRRRAAKFGVDYKEPGKVRPELTLESRRERLAREGFATGIDVFSKEEVDKRAQRAARFNLPAEGAQSLTYAPDEEDLAKARRAKKFGTSYQPVEGAMMDMDLFEERQEVGHDVQRRPDAIYLYGVDVMSTGDCLKYFGDYGPSFVEWINDSSCVVTFRDEFSAKRALAGLGRPLPADEMTGESSEGLDPTNPENMPYFWHRGKDFIKNGTPVHLILRMATVIDKKDMSQPKRTRELWKDVRRQQAPSGQQHQQGARKSRKGAPGQSARSGLGQVDEDGDVQMGDAEQGDEGGDGQQRLGKQRRKQRRKQRLADGSYGVMEVEDDAEGAGVGEGGMAVEGEGDGMTDQGHVDGDGLEGGQGYEADGGTFGGGRGRGRRGREGRGGGGGRWASRAEYLAAQQAAFYGTKGSTGSAATNGDADGGGEEEGGGASAPLVDILLRRIVRARRGPGAREVAAAGQEAPADPQQQQQGAGAGEATGYTEAPAPAAMAHEQEHPLLAEDS